MGLHVGVLRIRRELCQQLAVINRMFVPFKENDSITKVFHMHLLLYSERRMARTTPNRFLLAWHFRAGE